VSERVIEVGDKLHIVTRRLFEGDVRRHVVGEVTAVSDERHEVQGYTFVFSPGNNEYRKGPDLRTRVFSLGAAGLTVNKIPRDVAIESLQYRLIGNRLVVTDSGDFALDINEFGPLA
jgi:hypothetical protein